MCSSFAIGLPVGHKAVPIGKLKPFRSNYSSVGQIRHVITIKPRQDEIALAVVFYLRDRDDLPFPRFVSEDIDADKL
jgi:hypothetical protein